MLVKIGKHEWEIIVQYAYTSIRTDGPKYYRSDVYWDIRPPTLSGKITKKMAFWSLTIKEKDTYTYDFFRVNLD